MIGAQDRNTLRSVQHNLLKTALAASDALRWSLERDLEIAEQRLEDFLQSDDKEAQRETYEEVEALDGRIEAEEERGSRLARKVRETV